MTDRALEQWQSVVRQGLRANDRTQAWLRRQARISETQFSKQMHGHRAIDDFDLSAIAAVTGMHPDLLLAARDKEIATARRAE